MSKICLSPSGALKFCMNMLYYEYFKAWFLEFEVLGFWITQPKNQFTNFFFTKHLLAETPFDQTPLDRTPFDQKAIWPKHHLTEYTVDIFSGEPGESAQLRFTLKNFGRISSNLSEFLPLFSRRICWFGEISPKSKEICPKFLERNLTARIRPFRARKISTVYRLTKSHLTESSLDRIAV
jgi:hypothetical protein